MKGTGSEMVVGVNYCGMQNLPTVVYVCSCIAYCLVMMGVDLSARLQG